MIDNQPTREKDREFKELYYRLQEQGKRLSDVLSRLSGISDRIEGEDPVVKGGIEEGVPVSHLNTGLFRDLVSTAEGYGEVISKIESRVTKVERFI